MNWFFCEYITKVRFLEPEQKAERFLFFEPPKVRFVESELFLQGQKKEIQGVKEICGRWEEKNSIKCTRLYFEMLSVCIGLRVNLYGFVLYKVCFGRLMSVCGIWYIGILIFK
jgi:hypothetical protein